jgi:hypothetical protein
MDSKKIRRYLNKVTISGETKKSFWRKSKKFELKIYYTPVKFRIMIIEIVGLELDNPNLFINFKNGDTINLVYDWVSKYNHTILFERNGSEN